jgi:hypothetical protein
MKQFQSGLLVEHRLIGWHIDAITPFWRVTEFGSPLAKKGSLGEKLIINQRKNEKVRNK